MKKTGTVNISSLKIVANAQTAEAIGIIRAACADKYSLSLPDADADALRAIRVNVDSDYAVRRYTIEISESSGVSITADTTETLYYATQRFVQSILSETGELEECLIDSKMLLISDPSILAYDGKYYMASFVCNGSANAEKGYEIYVSENLYDWSEPIRAFDAESCDNAAFDGYKNFWAPEIFEYKGKFYIFATYRSRTTEHRGCAVFRSDRPDGKYELITNGHLTPSDWDCIDNSLYVDENGDPWMIFVHEWTSMPNKIGGMCAVRMSEDLTELVGEITNLFYANDAPWAPGNGVTDGPFVYRFDSGKLAMIWSGWSPVGYCIGVAYSENGVLGPWVQEEKCLYAKGIGDYRFGRDGGHGFIFRDLEGKLRVAFHGPCTQKGVYCPELDTSGDVLKIK